MSPDDSAHHVLVLSCALCCQSLLPLTSQIAFEWTAAKFFWFLFFEILSLTLFTMYGIASVALTPNVVVASIVSGESGLLHLNQTWTPA